MPLIKFVMEKEDKFVMDWMEELSWDANPFDSSIVDRSSQFMAGRKEERSKANIFVLSNHEFGTIKGSKGTGKTIFLKWLAEELEEHQHSVYPIYLSKEVLMKDELMIQEMVRPTLGFFERVFSKRKWKMLDSTTVLAFLKNKLKKRRMVLLVDGAGALTKQTTELLNSIILCDLPIQMIIAGTKREVEHTKLEKHKDELKIDLDKMSYEDTREMVQKRIEYVGGHDIIPFSDTLLKKVVTKVKGNPAEVLKTCGVMAVKSTVFHKMKQKKEVEEKKAAAPERKLAPPEKKEEEEVFEEAQRKERLEKIKKKVNTIDYVKNKKKKKHDVEVIENSTKQPSEDEYSDVDEKEKNDRLIQELFTDD